MRGQIMAQMTSSSGDFLGVTSPPALSKPSTVPWSSWSHYVLYAKLLELGALVGSYMTTFWLLVQEMLGW